MTTKGRAQSTFLFIAAVLMAALAVGCGSSGSSSSTDATSSGGSSAEFIKPGSKNVAAKFGTEADDAEREAASQVLEGNLEARAAGNWAAQCASLSAKTQKTIEESPSVTPGGKPVGCAQSLETQAQPVSATKEVRANTMTGPIAVLRVKGNKAFALYHGTKGKNYTIPMVKEDGTWKVDSVLTQEIP
jgi:hypothetical protein